MKPIRIGQPSKTFSLFSEQSPTGLLRFFVRLVNQEDELRFVWETAQFANDSADRGYPANKTGGFVRERHGKAAEANKLGVFVREGHERAAVANK